MNPAPLYYWVMMREHIRRMKSNGQPKANWSTDPILTTYRFCNVRREDDRGTVWIRECIREPFADHPYLWLMLCIGRQINWPATLGELIGTDAWPDHQRFDPSNLAAALRQRKATGAKVYTGAYMISAPPIKGANKQDYIANIVIGDLWRRRAQFNDVFGGSFPMQAVHALIMKSNGWGPFMAYQACVDMRYTRLLGNACDRFTWAAAGPGTLRGLNRISGRPFKQALSQQQALTEMIEIYRDIQRLTGVAMDFSDVPNVLCETDKLIRTQLGEGTPRSLYVEGRGY